MSASPEIFVIIVTYNGMKWMEKCLDCLESSDIAFKAIIIDNGSTDGTLQFIKERYKHFNLVESSENLGFAEANNIGMKMALEQGASFAFLLNQDCYIQSSTLRQLADQSRNYPEYGILSPVQLNGGGTAIDRNFQIYLRRTPAIMDDYILGSVKPIYPCDFVNAASWLMTKECMAKVGGFDTMVFFHYGEDNNYCQRTLFHGFKIGIVPSLKIEHDRVVAARPFNHQRSLTNVKIRVFDVNLSRRASLIMFVRQVVKLIFKALSNLLKLRFNIFYLRVRMVLDLVRLYVGKIKQNRYINRHVGYAWLK